MDLPVIRESEHHSDPDELDETMPALADSDDSDSPEDEGQDAAVPEAGDRAAPIAPVASPTPVLPAAGARAPAVQGTTEGMPLCTSLYAP